MSPDPPQINNDDGEIDGVLPGTVGGDYNDDGEIGGHLPGTGGGPTVISTILSDSSSSLAYSNDRGFWESVPIPSTTSQPSSLLDVPLSEQPNSDFWARNKRVDFITLGGLTAVTQSSSSPIITNIPNHSTISNPHSLQQHNHDILDKQFSNFDPVQREKHHRIFLLMLASLIFFLGVIPSLASLMSCDFLTASIILGGGSLSFFYGQFSYSDFNGALRYAVPALGEGYCVGYEEATNLLFFSRFCTVMGAVFGLIGSFCIFWYIAMREIKKWVWVWSSRSLMLSSLLQCSSFLLFYSPICRGGDEAEAQCSIGRGGKLSIVSLVFFLLGGVMMNNNLGVYNFLFEKREVLSVDKSNLLAPDQQKSDIEMTNQTQTQTRTDLDDFFDEEEKEQDEFFVDTDDDDTDDEIETISV